MADQIAAASNFFQSQAHILPPALCADSMKSMVASLCAQVQVMPALALPEAAIINGAIANSVFSQEFKAQLGSAVAQRCVAQAGDFACKRRTTQTLRHITNYLTEADWAYLHSPVSQAQKVGQVMDRLAALNLRNPSEATVAAVAAVVASAHCPSADACVLHTIVLEVKTAAAARSDRRARNVLAL